MRAEAGASEVRCDADERRDSWDARLPGRAFRICNSVRVQQIFLFKSLKYLYEPLIDICSSTEYINAQHKGVCRFAGALLCCFLGMEKVLKGRK